MSHDVNASSEDQSRELQSKPTADRQVSYESQISKKTYSSWDNTSTLSRDTSQEDSTSELRSPTIDEVKVEVTKPEATQEEIVSLVSKMASSQGQVRNNQHVPKPTTLEQAQLSSTLPVIPGSPNTDTPNHTKSMSPQSFNSPLQQDADHPKYTKERDMQLTNEIQMLMDSLAEIQIQCTEHTCMVRSESATTITTDAPTVDAPDLSSHSTSIQKSTDDLLSDRNHLIREIEALNAERIEVEQKLLRLCSETLHTHNIMQALPKSIAQRHVSSSSLANTSITSMLVHADSCDSLMAATPFVPRSTRSEEGVSPHEVMKPSAQQMKIVTENVVMSSTESSDTILVTERPSKTSILLEPDDSTPSDSRAGQSDTSSPRLPRSPKPRPRDAAAGWTLKVSPKDSSPPHTRLTVETLESLANALSARNKTCKRTLLTVSDTAAATKGNSTAEFTVTPRSHTAELPSDEELSSISITKSHDLAISVQPPSADHAKIIGDDKDEFQLEQERLKEVIVQSVQELERLTLKQVKQAQESKQNVEKLTKSKAVLEAEVEDLRRQLSKLQSDGLLRSKAILDNLRTKNTEMVNLNAELQHTVHTLRRQMKSMQQKLLKNEKTTLRLSSSNRGELSARDATIKVLQQQKQQLVVKHRNELASKDALINMLRSENDKRAVEIEQFQQQLTAASRETADKDKMHAATCFGLRRQLKRFKEQMSLQRRQIEQLETEASRTRNQNATSGNSNSDQLILENEGLLRQQVRLEAEIQHIKTTLQLMQSKESIVNKLQGEVRRVMQQNASLRDQLARSQHSHDSS